MKQEKKPLTGEKVALHLRNAHRLRYDFKQLVLAEPALKPFVKQNKFNEVSIDFADPVAVKMLNKALLKQFYHIDFWDIPANFLCPPIPGRADYIHYLADVLAESYQGKPPRGRDIRVLDIGVGASLIYPIIGQREYGWSFVGSDIEPLSIKHARLIAKANNGLDKAIDLRLQLDPQAIFDGIIKPTDYFDLTLCNPPFHASAQEAATGTLRKLRNLGKAVAGAQPVLNFGGQQNELCCEGGEQAFICRMVQQSVDYGQQCLWFSSLVAKKTTLPAVYQALKQAGALQIRTIDMAQGNKASRIVIWTFLNEAQRQLWCQQKLSLT